MTQTADVVVVGAGIIGLSVGYDLARRGVRVVLVDSRDVAAGTSGACDGNIMVQAKRPGLVLEMAKASLAMFPDLLAEIGGDVEYEVGGSMMVFDSEEDIEVLRPIVTSQRAAGLDVRLLTPAEAKDVQPGLSDVLIHASYLPTDASLDHFALSFALARAIRARGGTIELGRPVRSVLREHDRVSGVRTDAGDIFAPAVVLALGVWTPSIAETADVKVDILPRKGYILVTEKWPRMVHTALLSPSYVRHKHEAGAAALSGTESVSFSLHQSRVGTCFMGSSRELVGYDDSTSPDIVRAIAAAATRMFPSVADVRILRAFAGLRPYVPDGRPIVGETRSCPGLYVAAGHEGDGIALGPITGRIVSDLIVDRATSWDIASLDPDRFTVSHAATA